MERLITKRELRNEIEVLTRDVLAKKKENRQLEKTSMLLGTELDKLQARINKAEAYVKEHRYYSPDENNMIICGDELEQLLKILKGDDK